MLNINQKDFESHVSNISELTQQNSYIESYLAVALILEHTALITITKSVMVINNVKGYNALPEFTYTDIYQPLMRYAEQVLSTENYELLYGAL